jgi:hypothetical protein
MPQHWGLTEASAREHLPRRTRVQSFVRGRLLDRITWGVAPGVRILLPDPARQAWPAKRVVVHTAAENQRLGVLGAGLEAETQP